MAKAREARKSDAGMLATLLERLNRDWPYELSGGAGSYTFSEAEVDAVNDMRKALPHLIELVKRQVAVK